MTSDVRLRDVAEADLPIFFEHQLDPVATQMAAFPSRDRDAFMVHWARILSDASVVKQTILVDGQVAGNTGARALPPGRWPRFWATSPRGRCTPTLRNTTSARGGCSRNVASRSALRARTAPAQAARRSKRSC